MAAKNGGKAVLGKVSILYRYPVGQKFRRNHSIPHRFRDKCTVAFYAEIQHGCQKWQESDFLRNVTTTLYRHPAGQKLPLKSLYLTPFSR